MKNYIAIYTDDGGRLFIEGAHHDGDNIAEFVTLTERGAALLNKWLFDYSDERTEKQRLGRRFGLLREFRENGIL